MARQQGLMIIKLLRRTLQTWKKIKLLSSSELLYVITITKLVFTPVTNTLTDKTGNIHYLYALVPKQYDSWSCLFYKRT